LRPPQRTTAAGATRERTSSFTPAVAPAAKVSSHRGSSSTRVVVVASPRNIFMSSDYERYHDAHDGWHRTSACVGTLAMDGVPTNPVQLLAWRARGGVPVLSWRRYDDGARQHTCTGPSREPSVPQRQHSGRPRGEVDR